MCGEDLAALHQMRKSERGGDADTPGVELNLRVCSCAGLLRASLPRSFINDNEGDGQIIRSQSLSLSTSLSLSPYRYLCVSLALSQSLFLFLFSPSIFISIASVRISVVSLSAHSVCPPLPPRPETHD